LLDLMPGGTTYLGRSPMFQNGIWATCPVSYSTGTGSYQLAFSFIKIRDGRQRDASPGCICCDKQAAKLFSDEQVTLVQDQILDHKSQKRKGQGNNLIAYAKKNICLLDHMDYIMVTCFVFYDWTTCTFVKHVLLIGVNADAYFLAGLHETIHIAAYFKYICVFMFKYGAYTIFNLWPISGFMNSCH
ncbi:hypothetical protein ACJX0J_038431, partial [Zea mays]